MRGTRTKGEFALLRVTKPIAGYDEPAWALAIEAYKPFGCETRHFSERMEVPSLWKCEIARDPTEPT